MLRVRTERADDLAILKCNGRIVRGQEIVLESAVLEEKYAHVDGIADLVPLSLQIARFKLAAIYRKSARRGEGTQVSVDEIQIPDLSQDTADEYERREMMSRLATAINQLPARCREMIRWKLQGHNFDEIRKLLKLDSINTVYSQDFRCRKQLIELMGGALTPAKDGKRSKEAQR